MEITRIELVCFPVCLFAKQVTTPCSPNPHSRHGVIGHTHLPLTMYLTACLFQESTMKEYNTTTANIQCVDSLWVLTSQHFQMSSDPFHNDEKGSPSTSSPVPTSHFTFLTKNKVKQRRVEKLWAQSFRSVN